MGFPLINYGSVPGTVTTWKAYKESPEENCLLCPPTALDGKSDRVSQRSIRCRSLWRRSGQARLGPILRGKAKEYRLSGTFASSWCLGAINPSPSHVSLHRTEAKGSLFSVFGFISREKTRYAFIQLGGNRPLPCHFLDQCFYALLRTKKTWMDAFHIKMRHSLKQCKFVIYPFSSVKTVP